MSTLAARAEEILAQAKQLDTYIASSGLPHTSFAHDSLTELPAELERVRLDMVNSTQQLKRLAQGAVSSTVEMLYSFTDVTTLRAIYHFKISQAVPLNGSVTFEEIAQQVSLPTSLVSRFIRHAVASHILIEPLQGQIAHSAISRALLMDENFFEAVGLLTNEFAPASNSLVAALEKYPDSQEPNHTGYNLENNTPLPIYDFLLHHPSRLERFGKGMQYFSRMASLDLKYLREGYDWDSIDRPESLMVDVGGGHGAVSQYLASSTLHLRFIVQDLPPVIESRAAPTRRGLEKRIDFMPHDFFTKQPVRGANIYFMRWILHNWSDKYCLQILRNLVPALHKGSRVILYEALLPDKSVTKVTQKQGLNLDMVVLSCFNAAERTIEDWQKLFEVADRRFRFDGVVTPQGSAMSIIRAQWV